YREPLVQLRIVQMSLPRPRGLAGRRSASGADGLQLFRFVHLYSATCAGRRTVHDNYVHWKARVIDD
ncbi:MAG: hypothetical protein WBZ08_24970, partial [Pseudolabrys sp.]